MFDVRDLKRMGKEDLLNLIGLEPRRTAVDWIWPALGFVGVGLAVGAGLGLLLAPKAGRELREDLRHRLQPVSDAVRGGYTQLNVGEHPQRTM